MAEQEITKYCKECNLPEGSVRFYSSSHKVCVDCSRRKARERYHADIKPSRRSSRLASRKYRANHREEISARERTLSKAKKLARAAVAKALAEGKLVKPARCEDCDRRRKHLEAHHFSYAYRYHLVVEWLCYECHQKADAKRRQHEKCSDIACSGGLKL